MKMSQESISVIATELIDAQNDHLHFKDEVLHGKIIIKNSNLIEQINS